MDTNYYLFTASSRLDSEANAILARIRRCATLKELQTIACSPSPDALRGLKSFSRASHQVPRELIARAQTIIRRQLTSLAAIREPEALSAELQALRQEWRRHLQGRLSRLLDFAFAASTRVARACPLAAAATPVPQKPDKRRCFHCTPF